MTAKQNFLWMYSGGVAFMSVFSQGKRNCTELSTPQRQEICSKPATFPAMFVVNAASARRTDQVRTRVSAGRQITNAECLQSFAPKARQSRKSVILDDVRNLGGCLRVGVRFLSRESRGSQAVNAEDAFAGPRLLHHRALRTLGETRGTGPHGPHPGDILYWAACLGGACLLLIAATT